MKRAFAALFIGGACLVVSLLGLGLSAHRSATPADAWSLFFKIHPADGWIQSGSAILPRHLAARGNRMLLRFNTWRPAGQPPARLRVYLCDQPVSEFSVVDDSFHRVYLSGGCEPRTVRFEVLNPFTPSASDTRGLGAQLQEMRIVSRIGLPIVRFDYIIGVALGVFACVLLFMKAFSGTTSIIAGSGVLALWLFLLAFARYVNISKITPVWLALCCCASGLILARRAWSEAPWGLRLQPLGENSNRITSATFLALLAVLIGGALRFYGLDFGLPANFHPDEVPKVNAVMRMVDQNTLNPQYFLHPSLLLYSTYFMNTLLHFFGMTGEFRDTAYFAGRIVSALAGTLSIYFVYVIGARLYSRSSGVIAAFLLAVFPLHVTCSRYLKEDALLLAVILACVVAVLKAARENRPVILLLGGLLAGAAMSTKYSGLLAVAIVGAAPWLRSGSWKPDRRFAVVALIAFLMVPVGFALCTPYSILDSRRFLHDLRFERNHMLRGHTITISAFSQYWSYHLWRSIVPGMSLFSTMLALLAGGLLIWRRRIEDLFLIALVLLFYLPAEYVKAKPAPQPERYILPCLPFLAIMIAELCRVLWQSRARLVVPVILLLAVGAPAMRSGELASEIHYDTRERMADWMKQNVPRGSRVYVDWKPYEPRFFEGEFEIVYLPRDRLVAELKTDSLRASEQDYLLLSSLWYGRYFNQPRSDLLAQRRIRKVFDTLPRLHEVRPTTGTYGFHNPSITLFDLKAESGGERADSSVQYTKDRSGTPDEYSRAALRW